MHLKMSSTKWQALSGPQCVNHTHIECNFLSIIVIFFLNHRCLDPLLLTEIRYIIISIVFCGVSLRMHQRFINTYQIGNYLSQRHIYFRTRKYLQKKCILIYISFVRWSINIQYISRYMQKVPVLSFCGYVRDNGTHIVLQDYGWI